MKEEIGKLTTKPKLLLHSCCGPCSTSVLDRLRDYFCITIFYFNPNIDTNEEFLKRLGEEKKVVKNFNEKNINKIEIVQVEYDNSEFYSLTKNLTNEPEGGKRCDVCFALRLDRTAKFAKENGFDYFSTTLSVSPHKNSEKLNTIGLRLSEKYEVKFLAGDFKKEDGYKKSIEFSKQLGLYRQDYCGCEFSKNRK